MIAQLFLKYLISQQIHCTNFHLAFETICDLSGKVIFKGKLNHEVFRGKFAIHDEPYSNSTFITIILTRAIFKTTNKNSMLPENVFIAETETLQESLDRIESIETVEVKN